MLLYKKKLLFATSPLQKPFDYLPCILCVLNADGLIQFTNKEFIKVLGYPTQEVCNQPFTDFLQPSDRERFKKAIVDLKAGKGPVAFPHDFSKKNGSTIPVTWMVGMEPEEQLIYCTAASLPETRQSIPLQ